MAAYLEGRLSQDAAAAVDEHLADCFECRLIAGETSRFAREEGREAQPERPSRPARTWWLAAAAALVVAVTAALVSLRIREQHNDPRALLAETSARNGRVLEPRLAGFPWSRLTVSRHGPEIEDRGQRKVRGDAEKVLETVERQSSPEALHTSGVAHLLIGDVDEAVDNLERASRGSADPRVWNDLAAAYDTAATRGVRPSAYPQALAAADRALQLKRDSAAPEAVFNRALILEHMGLADRARAQWQSYLTLDPISPWSREAADQLKNLQPQQGTDFPGAFGRASAALAAGDAAPLDALVRESPQDARTWGEGPLLAQWAEAVHRNDSAAARPALNLVRRIAEQLAARNGERLLADAVGAIDAAQSDPVRLRALADAHTLYLSGRSLAAKPAAAERDLKAAATLFLRGGSPMEQVAMRSAASMTFDQNRIAEARALFLDLQARCDRERHRALDAAVASQLARCDAFAGDWTAALQHALRSAEIFDSLGESGNAAFLRVSVAGAYDHMGDPERAWTLWVASIKALNSDRDRSLQHSAVANALRSCIRNRMYAGAIALAQVAIEDLRGSGDALLFSDARIQRARAAAENGDDAAAMIAEARGAAATLSDTEQRARAEADLKIVQGIAARRADPGASIAQFSQAIDFYRDHQYAPWLIEAYFQRGRSYAAAGRPSDAADDFQRAMDGMEQQRTTIADARAREHFFDIEPGLFEEITALRFSQRDVAGAFAIADRARARTLREQMGIVAPAAALEPRTIQAALPAGTAILEYAFVPSGVVIFCLTPQVLTATQITLDRAAVRGTIADFRAAIERDEDIDRVNSLGRRLHGLLIAPVRQQLTGIAHVISIADRDLQSVPFAALVDGATGEYLVNELAVSLAPSASLAAHADRRVNANGRSLFIGNPAIAGVDPLPAAEREAGALGRLYRDSLLLTGRQATKQQLLSDAPRAGIIHYAGHARPEGRSAAALLLAGDAGSDGALDAGEIARLRLPAAELVVIAGCSTARGATQQMEGVPSLARAFMAAGAQVVVATLWDIDDGLTSPLFTAFHRAILSGEPPARALQLAQIAALRSSDALEKRPSTWGGVVVVDSSR